MDLQAPLGNLSATQKDQLMTEVRQQIAVANAQELVTVSIHFVFTGDFKMGEANEMC